MVMFLRYYRWFLGSGGDPRSHHCVIHSKWLRMGWAESGLGAHFGVAQRDINHLAKRLMTMVIFPKYF